jgi:hypothetical protein
LSEVTVWAGGGEALATRAGGLAGGAEFVAVAGPKEKGTALAPKVEVESLTGAAGAAVCV